jgi:membrane protein implicated in regulation of membrane protease activity
MVSSPNKHTSKIALLMAAISGVAYTAGALANGYIHHGYMPPTEQIVVWIVIAVAGAFLGQRLYAFVAQRCDGNSKNSRPRS